jgi:hypothetical protein
MMLLRMAYRTSSFMEWTSSFARCAPSISCRLAAGSLRIPPLGLRESGAPAGDSVATTSSVDDTSSAYYASRFDTVEINNTFYRLPDASTFAAWRKQATPGFYTPSKPADS